MTISYSNELVAYMYL